jgi:hypothetical protein
MIRRFLSLCALSALAVPLAVLAFDATSTSYFVRQQIESFSGGAANSGYSTSTSYRLVSSGGQTAVGTSTSGTSYNLYGGILNNLFRSPAPSYDQKHYHFRNDNGSETTATSGTSGTQDTATSSVPKSTTLRIRFAVSNEGGTQVAYSTQQFRIEYAAKSGTCAASSGWTDVGAGAGDWDMSNTANLTDGANTTNIANGTGGVTDENHTFISSNAGVKDTSSTVSALSVPSDSFVELEYAVTALAAATDGGTYCFRLTNAGSTTNFTYTAYPEATLANSSSLSLTVTTNNFTSITPGQVQFATSTINVNTSNSTGWFVTLSGDNKTSVQNNLLSGANSIADQTEWVNPAATTSAGNAVRIGSLANSANVLAYRVMTASGTASFRATAWWGTTDSYADSATTLWAGISSSTVSRRIGNSSVSSGGGNALNSVVYYLSVPATQPTGSYSGDLTIIATANP